MSWQERGERKARRRRKEEGRKGRMKRERQNSFSPHFYLIKIIIS
jgi:hypothetical protein